MKLKFSLLRPGRAERDLQATLDTSITIQDVAGYLAAADPDSYHDAREARSGAVPLTLALADEEHRALSPDATLRESGLRSGATVAITRAPTHYEDVHAPTASLHVIEGPDAGSRFPIPSGTSYMGRGTGCEVRLKDPSVSRQHARLQLTDVLELTDLGSANGVTIGEQRITKALLQDGTELQIGDSKLRVHHQVSESDAVINRDDAIIGFSRSPRLWPVYEGAEFKLPELPERPRPVRFPYLSLTVPVFMGVVMFAITRSPYAAVFLLMSPLMMLASVWEQRRDSRREYATALADFREDLSVIVARVRAELTREGSLRRGENPSPQRCLRSVHDLDSLLWGRRADLPGFLLVRLGLADLPSRIRIETPQVGRSRAETWVETVEAIDGLSEVPDVPVVADLSRSALGIAGERAVALGLARSVMTQVAALHSPSELALMAITSPAGSEDWEWLKWLPHTSTPHSPVSAAHLASSTPTANALVSELEDLIEKGTPAPGTTPSPPTMHVVLLVEGNAPLERSRLVDVAEHGPRAGVSVVWLAPNRNALPAACRTFVETSEPRSAARRPSDAATGLVEAEEGELPDTVDDDAASVSRVPGVGYVSDGLRVSPVRVETLSAQECAAASRSLSPVEDSGSRTDDDSDLPSTVSFVNLIQIPPAELDEAEQRIVERWSESRSILTGPFAPEVPHDKPGNLRAAVGQSAAGVFSIDLRSDGPHALVGGTTGAGKSELLQAWILGMASAHSPQRVNFLLVDYKGGSAFHDCVNLPHTVGLVTDLNRHLVRRVMVSLGAEIHYRERLLERHKAKDLVSLERSGAPDAPPSLVIVVDEFAALKQEIPEFVDGVINVAQRGRSLGLHLILATQRPTGVIDGNLRANTNLRVALRMADEGDSTDVLGTPTAAFFDPSLPGRAVAKSGPGRLTSFQTGYAGGWTSATPPPPEIRVSTLTFGQGEPVERPREITTTRVDLGPTDIQRLVTSISKAAERAELPDPRRPWLDELRVAYDLGEMRGSGSDAELEIGIADDPQTQSQPVAAFHPDADGNLAVFGTSGSGKTVLLRTLAAVAGLSVSSGRCQVYGLDFANRGLAMIEVLPHVGDVINGNEEERVIRLLSSLRATIDDRSLRYQAASAGNISDFRARTGTRDEPRILVLVDGITAFRQEYDVAGLRQWSDLLDQLAAEGRAVGVHFVFSADQRTALAGSLNSSVQKRVVLRMATDDDYATLGVPSDVLSATSTPGRGLFEGKEIQVAVLGGSAEVLEQSRSMKGLAATLRRHGVGEAPAIATLPDEIPLADLQPLADEHPVLGLASATLAPIGFEPHGSFVVTGPAKSGRTTAFAALAVALRRARPKMRLYAFSPRQTTPLRELDAFVEVAVGEEQGLSLAERVLAETENAPPGTVGVFLERMDDLSDELTRSGTIMENLVKRCLDEEQFVAAEGEVAAFHTTYDVFSMLRTSRSGLVLQPDGNEENVFRAQFPNIARAQFPPGRGLLVQRGVAGTVQVGRVML